MRVLKHWHISQVWVGQRNLEWLTLEDEFIITLDEQLWTDSSIISFDEATNIVKAQHLELIKTRAKDDIGKTYWVYTEDESIDV